MITSTKNRQVAKAARLKKRALRDRERLFLVESAQVALEALEGGRVEVLYHVPLEGGRGEPVVERARAAGVPTQAVSEGVIAHLTSTVTPQGMVAVSGFVDVPLTAVPADAALVPILCSVRDPGNAGTILRSADAAGADAVVFTTSSVDVYNPKAVRASAGSLFRVPVVRGVAPEEAVSSLRARGMQVLAAAADGEASVYDADFSRPTAVLFGNEAWGLESEVRALADGSVRVPIPGRAESLNLAAAAALVMFESARARAAGDASPVARIAALMGAAAHDIRSPLTAITGFSRTLVTNWERLEEAKRREIVEGMLLDGERVNVLLRLLVDAVRVQTKTPLTGLGEWADVGEAARWASDLFQRSPDLPEIRVEGSAEASVSVDRLRALLVALCDGALWWSTEGPIEIGITSREDAAEVDVRRAGGGPDAGEAEVMFREPGAGGKVGLYAAHLLAEALGGTLGCEGGDGVRFRLVLPA